MYTRVERVVYVVGLPGRATPLADVLLGDKPPVMEQRDRGKGFRSMSDKDLIYCERIGIAPQHRGDRHKALFERARHRASVLNVLYADLEVRDG